MHLPRKTVDCGMTHTFWHLGILMGEAALETSPDEPLRRAGEFQPTAYGEALFPRLTGILAAGHALKHFLDANGLDPETMGREAVDEMLDSTPAGQKVMDIGRTLSEVEVRGPDGERLEFESLGFTDLMELRNFARELLEGAETEEDEDDDDLNDEIDEPSPDTPRYLVSFTLRSGPSDSPYTEVPAHTP